MSKSGSFQKILDIYWVAMDRLSSITLTTTSTSKNSTRQTQSVFSGYLDGSVLQKHIYVRSWWMK